MIDSREENRAPDADEKNLTQVPAILTLMRMGYEYLSPAEAWGERREKYDHVLLEGILEKQLRKLNRVVYKGEEYPFSNNNITAAVEALKYYRYDGLVHTSSAMYDKLVLGKSFAETIQGSTQSHTIRYIDWDNWENNVFHVTGEFRVDHQAGKKFSRADIVIFVNGIPLGVIETKIPGVKDGVEEGIRQILGYQDNARIPKLFVYSQILMVTDKDTNLYATVGAKREFWNAWQEAEDNDRELCELIQTPLAGAQLESLFSGPFAGLRSNADALSSPNRSISPLDRALASLFKPERLIELSYGYTIYDKGEKKIARYNQYFAVKNTMKRVMEFGPDGRRNGGVIWHTQGSGKSLTMVMIAKALAREKSIVNPRIVLVTDRVNLDDQIYKTFIHCRMAPKMATSGRKLLALLQNDGASIVTTVVDKFRTAFSRSRKPIASPNIFVLVDESHRSQYGETNIKMMRVLTAACYIGFTGTPLKKADKNTAQKFGGFIDTYTLDQAVKDKVIVPLLYEGRHAVQDVSKKSIDTWADRISEPLPEYEANRLKKRYSAPEKLNQAEQKIWAIAYDIREHFLKTWKNTNFKGQLAAPSKATALRYKKFLDDLGGVTSEVLISPPNFKEGPEDEDTFEERQEVAKFWKRMMERFGDEERYNKELRGNFKDADEPELIIVVHKLLTGFDAPRNTVMYITRKMEDHTLLQAIARVNRVCAGKDFGYIIDYRGVLGYLDKALTKYRALANFDSADLEGTLLSVMSQVRLLPRRNEELWGLFEDVKDKKDDTAFVHYLGESEDVRREFFDKLAAFAKTLDIALSTLKFYEEVEPERIAEYKNDLKFFSLIRERAKSQYAELLDFKSYEPRFRKLLDTYIATDEIVPVTKLVNIFDKEAFELEVARIEGTAARADTIAHRTRKSIEERFEEDPAYYEKFSKMLEKTIEDYRKQRIHEAEYLARVKGIEENVRERKGDDIPYALRDNEEAKAFYGVILRVMEERVAPPEQRSRISCDMALAAYDIIRASAVVDWQYKDDIQNEMRNQLEDYLYMLKDRRGAELSFEDIDRIMEDIIKVARIRMAM